MGCATSKIDDTDAVALCRSRLAALDDALRLRYALSDAHLAYLHSLNSVGVSLHRFFHSSAGGNSLSSAAAPPPFLNLPEDRKLDNGDGKEEEEEEDEEYPGHHLKSPGSSSHYHHHHLSHSSSGSHIQFNPDSDSEEEDEISGPDHDPGMYRNPEGFGLGLNFNPHNTQMNFMKKQPTPSVSYHQKPVGMESIQIGMANPEYYPYYMPNQNPNLNLYGDPYDAGGGSGGGGGGGYGNGMGGFFGGGPYYSPVGVGGLDNQSQPPPPPPPPPPPSTGTWDFLNPFESIEANYPLPYAPSRASKGSRDSREVREEEGIPDLEDEDFHQEAVNDGHLGKKLGDDSGGSSSDGGRKSNPVVAETEAIGAAHMARPSDSQEPDRVEYKVHLVDKEVVGEEGRRSEEQGNVGAFNGRRGGLRNVSEVVQEIQVQFERASDLGGELAKMLEAGKLPYRHKSSAYHVSSKMLCAISPSLPSTSKDSDSAADADEDMELSSGKLSATLQKLYLWEKKLFEEVKVEEKYRVAHDRKVEKLRRLDEKGAEVHKIDATRVTIRDLSTKIRISIQIIDKISVKISKLRDEDLWPQLNELIHGFSRMWKGMLECHQIQCQAINGATGLDAIASSKNSTDAHLEAVLHLEHELINWTSRFSNWIHTQKGYVIALNNWLLNCIVSEPEQTPDGEAPFSPGRAGAPPVFVICNQWAQALDRLSEKEVVDSLRVFAAMIFQFWERDKVEMQHRMVADKDVERMVKNLQREDVKIQKQIQALDKKMVPSTGEPIGLSVSGDVVYPSDAKMSLQSGLQHIFEAMDRYTSESSKVYEELLLRSEEVVRRE